MLKFVVAYIAVGWVATWATVGFSIWTVTRKCAGHEDIMLHLTQKYFGLPQEMRETSRSTPVGVRLRAVVVDLLLWERKVVQLLRINRCELREADELIRAKAVAALNPEAWGRCDV